MGRTCELLPPSEALPAIGDHCVVFHNGRGFYFACREYSTSLEKRQFQCVRAECGVTASMGPELGSPLQDHGSHTHPADWEYRDKCLLLHTIKQRFLRENASAPLILQEILASLSLKNEEDNQDTWDFESVTIDEESPSLMIKEEPYLDPINENSELTELNDSSTVLQSTKRTYSRVRSIEKDWTDHSSSDVEEEDTDDGLGFIVVKGDELCERLGIPEKSLDDPVHELEGTDKNRKRKQLLCKRKESLQEQAEESTSFFLQPVKRMYKSRTKENTSVEASFSKQKEKGDDDPELVVLKEEEREVIIIDERLESSEDSSETMLQRKSWNRENMKEAVYSVKNKEMGILKASKRFGVPKTTLSSYVKKPVEELHKWLESSCLGRKPVLSDKIEDELVEYCLTMEKSHHGLSAKDVKRMAFQLALRSNIHHPFSVKKQSAGNKWLRLFLERHPSLSIKIT
uniref:HTH CENPB-type domain-containing protein n=1 Tax=Graphocephala atropunctata TaxID=36148 RepID=A0A1B6ME32_9HEMI